MKQFHAERYNLLQALRVGLANSPAETLLHTYESTFACERQSDTWYDCPKGTADPEHKDLLWCRTCVARKLVQLEG